MPKGQGQLNVQGSFLAGLEAMHVTRDNLSQSPYNPNTLNLIHSVYHSITFYLGSIIV